MLYEAAARLVEAVERLDRNAPVAQPLLAQALGWAVTGLGFTPEEAAALRAQGFDFYDWGPGEARLVIARA